MVVVADLLKVFHGTLMIATYSIILPQLKQAEPVCRINNQRLVIIAHRLEENDDPPPVSQPSVMVTRGQVHTVAMARLQDTFAPTSENPQAVSPEPEDVGRRE